MSIVEAILFGAVEGASEFLPISSTGHLILLSHMLGIEQDNFHKSFEIIIQLGAILAVVVYFFKDIFKIDIILKLFVAFLPVGIIGFFAYSTIKSLFDAQVVAYMLILGGIVFILMDLFFKDKNSTSNINDITLKQSFFIGCFQVLSMIPGTSRSGATIIGGLVNKLDKVTSAKFSFLLAVPTMTVATLYDVYKNYEYLSGDFAIEQISIAFIVSFLVALVAIKFFLNIVRSIGFYPFGIYRIVLGVVFLVYL